MAKANRQRPARVNFFDGQRITESDLDAEQIHHRSLISDLTKDFHGSGIVRDRLFESRVIFDTRKPGEYSDDGNEVSKFIVDSGNYDGRAISVDRQPTDREYGNRLEVEAVNLNIGGRVLAKVMIIGRAYSSLNPAGELVVEVLEFSRNQTKLSKFYYVNVIAVIFNNLSGGKGRTEVELLAESVKTISDTDSYSDKSGGIILRESDPLKVFANPGNVRQVEGPNISLRDFITSSTENTIEQEIRVALGTLHNFNELYFELESKSQLFFEKDGDQTVLFGQKFLAESNNIQRLDILLSAQRDDLAPIDNQFAFSGEIVVSIHKLSTDIKCITDPNPDNLLDFDPEQSPLMELSYDSDDLIAMGVELTDVPKVVSFDFSGTLLADPNISPSIIPGEFYAFLVGRRGDNRTGTLIMEKAHSRVSKKESNGQSLNVIERFGRKNSRFLEFDPHNSTYVDDEDSSLWFAIHSNSIEITDGIAYADDGYPIVLPKTEEYVGSSKISRYLQNIDLKDVSEGGVNYIVLHREDLFESPGVHPRTGNFVNTRIKDNPSVSVVTESELSSFDEDAMPIILARVVDKNTKEAQDISDTFDKPGLVRQDEIILLNPSSEVLTTNLIGRVLTPDTDCVCTAKYRIVDVWCEVLRAGDFDNDGKLTSSDIISLLSIVGNTINAETTERRILGGELDVVDFIKADLNGDGTIDGDDILLLEDATEGSYNFSVDETFNILRIKVENILEKNNYPVIAKTDEDSSSAGSGTTTSNQDKITLSVKDEEQALAIRPGDTLEIHSGADSGTYLIKSKMVDETGKGLEINVVDLSQEAVLFSGQSGLDVTITSGNHTNMLADNFGLLRVPFKGTSWEITHEGFPHTEDFVEACDLRRYVETNFIEEENKKCVCEDDTCLSGEKCSPKYRNQKVLSNDLFIPDGEIYSKPGVPYHGDIEYATISIPMPPGSLDDCSVNLYTNFIKSDGGSCETAAGYPAMQYSDGTYVGCEDSGGETDITKGRVKIDQCIASLYVDSFVDGYMVDGYADETEVYTPAEIVTESFVDHTYPNTLGFTEWSPESSNILYAKTTSAAGSNEPVYFDLTTVSGGYRYAKINYPEAVISDLSGDFVIDFIASRAQWDKGALLYGSVYFHSYLTIVNSDGTEAHLKFGWKQYAHKDVKICYSGTIHDSASMDVISDFNFEVDAPDDIDDIVKFRLRRVDEAVFAMYFDKTLIDDIGESDGQYTRVGGLVPVQPGTGDAKVLFEISQDGNPNPSQNYACTLHKAVLKSDLVANSLEEVESLVVGRDPSSSVSKITATYPILLTRRTNIVSATLSLKVDAAISSTELFNVIPYDLVNGDNLGKIIDYPLEENHSFVTTFSPGDLVVGDSIDIDVTGIMIYFLSQPGHLPGFYKAISIEPSANTEEELFISKDINLTIEYEDITTGVVFKIGSSLDPSTGIVTFHTKNILYDSVNEANRTVLNFGVHLKKSGFKNEDVKIGIKDLVRIGIGTCQDETPFEEDELCFFIAGSTATGTFVEGPFPCYFHLP